MQTMICYYYHNDVDVQLNIDPTLTLRNRVEYMRLLKLYKGIDNVVRFTFKNSDQQRVNITGWDVEFNIISDEEASVVVSTPATVIDANAGVVTATVSELDLLDLNNRFYSYSVMVTDPLSGTEQVVYADESYGARGELELLSGHYPTFRRSIDVLLPAPTAGVITTSAVVSDTPTRQQSAHHTVQYYFDNFTGDVEVQVTLDALIPGPANWATLTTTTFTDQTANAYQNFDGVFSAVRFVITPVSGSVTKILYRA